MPIVKRVSERNIIMSTLEVNAHLRFWCDAEPGDDQSSFIVLQEKVHELTKLLKLFYKQQY